MPLGPIRPSTHPLLSSCVVVSPASLRVEITEAEEDAVWLFQDGASELDAGYLEF